MEEETDSPSPPPPFIEVKCETSGLRRRFATGTEAGFATSVINNKLGSVDAVYIEAIKEGEEPITFGPSSLLVDYGHAWTLHTVTGEPRALGPKPFRVPHVKVSDNLHAAKRVPDQEISIVYIGKIVIALILIFILGAGLTLVLENVPRLIELVKQYMSQDQQDQT